MSGLWTPEGERPPITTSPEGTAAPSGADLSPEDAYHAEMEALASELLAAPVGDVIANHCYGLFELAALHLSQQPPHIEEARAAIDAFGAVVEGLGSRLGDATATLEEGLANLRLAFVQIAAAHSTPEDEPR